MVELSIDNIDEGKARKEFNAKIRKAFKELLQYQKDTDSSDGKAIVTLSVTIHKTANTKDHFNVVHSTKVSVPTIKNTSVVKARGERLLCQPIGASLHDPEQQAFFDASGRIIGGVDPDTGELIEEEPHVAGKIAQA